MSNISSEYTIQKELAMIEEICKTNGEYLKKAYKDPETAIESVLDLNKDYAQSVKRCFKDPNNFINDLMKYSYSDSNMPEKWASKFTEYLLKAAKKGIDISNSFVEKFKLSKDDSLSEGIIFNSHMFKIFKKGGNSLKLAFLWAGGLVFGIISSIIIIAIGLWMRATGSIVTKLRDRTKLDKALDKTKKFLGLNNEDDIPDDLEPPNLDVPNFNVNLSEGLVASAKSGIVVGTATIAVKTVFLFALKAVLSLNFGGFAATAITFGVASFAPAMNLIAYLVMWVSMGCISAVKYAMSM